MHQGLHGARHEAVVHEEVLVDIELVVEPLEIAGAVADHAMAQREVLRTRRRPDRIGLDESKQVERALQRGGREKAIPNGSAPNFVQGCHEF
jgi:hypothetical protein